MDIIEFALFAIAGLVCLIGRHRAFGNQGRLIPFLGMLFSLIWISQIYSSSPPGLEFSSFNSGYSMTAGDAVILPIIVIFLDAWACIGP